MSGKEYKAKSIEEALERALNEMMLTRDDIEYEVITQPSNGFLGIGRRDAVIRVKKKVIEELKDIVADIKEERRAAQPEAEQAKPAAEPAPQAPVAKEAPVEEDAPKAAVQETAVELEAVVETVVDEEPQATESFADKAPQKAVDKKYQDRDAWIASTIQNMVNMGFFSSDRTILEYAKNIWKIEPLKLEK